MIAIKFHLPSGKRCSLNCVDTMCEPPARDHESKTSRADNLQTSTSLHSYKYKEVLAYHNLRTGTWLIFSRAYCRLQVIKDILPRKNNEVQAFILRALFNPRALTPSSSLLLTPKFSTPSSTERIYSFKNSHSSVPSSAMSTM